MKLVICVILLQQLNCVEHTTKNNYYRGAIHCLVWDMTLVPFDILGSVEIDQFLVRFSAFVQCYVIQLLQLMFQHFLETSSVKNLWNLNHTNKIKYNKIWSLTRLYINSFNQKISIWNMLTMTTFTCNTSYHHWLIIQFCSNIVNIVNNRGSYSA